MKNYSFTFIRWCYISLFVALSSFAANASQDFRAVDVSEREFKGGGAIAIVFSEPLAEQNLSDYLSVNSKKSGVVLGDWDIAANRRTVYFLATEPSTDYQVKVRKGLRSVSGKFVRKAVSFSLKTRAVTPSISLSVDGSVIQKGSDVGLPLTMINVESVDVDFHRVHSNSIAEFLSSIGSKRLQRGYNLNRLNSMMTLVRSERYDFEVDKNRVQKRNITIQNLPELAKPGVYFVVLRQPGDYSGRYSTGYFTVSDIGLHVRHYSNTLDVYAHSLTTTEALHGIKVELLGNQGVVIDSGLTDKDGRIQFLRSGYPKLDAKVRLLTAASEESFTILNLRSPTLDLSEFDLGRRPQQSLELFSYSERDLYRPGETVRVSALLRNYDGMSTKDVPLQVSYHAAGGKRFHEETVKSQGNGYYETQYDLPSNATTGNWTVEFKGPSREVIKYPFKVEEFLPERLALTFTPPRSAAPAILSANTNVKVALQADYLYGAPAGGNKVEVKASLTHSLHPLTEFPDYFFGDEVQAKKQALKFDMKDLITKADGSLELDINPRWKLDYSPMELGLFTSVFESGGRPVSRYHRSIVWPKKTLIGILPSFKERNPSSDSTVKFSLINADKTGTLHKANGYQAVLIREDRRYFWVFSNNRGWHYEMTDSEFPVDEQAVSFSSDTATDISVDLEWGNYRLEVRNSKGKVEASYRFFAGYNWYANWSNNQNASQAARPDKVSLAWDKEAYSKGDYAGLSIVPPHAGKALILIESDKLLWSKTVAVPAEGHVEYIPIDSEWDTHNIYVTVVHLQQEQGKSSQKKRSLGLIHLPLDRSLRKLDIEIGSPPKAMPNQTIDVPVKVIGSQSANITLAAVDVGVLSITDFETPKPFEFFFEPRRMAAYGSDMYQKLIESNENAFVMQRSGGDASLSRGGKNAQAEVNIVSLFSGAVEADADGNAIIPLSLPDFNGRIRLMAIAFDDHRFGSAEKEMTIAAPIVAEIAMPRFVASSDSTSFALDIHNVTDEAQAIQLSLNASGPVSISDGSARFKLAPKQKEVLRFDVIASYPEKGQDWRSDITLSLKATSAVASEFNLTRRWGLQLRHPYPAITKRFEMSLAQGESFVLSESELEGLILDTTELALVATNYANLSEAEQFKYLLRYPYGCLEQTTSSTFPWLFATEVDASKYNISNSKEATFDILQRQAIETGIGRLKDKLRLGGGFGLWGSQSNEEHWLTAYAADLLFTAKDQGFNVDSELYNKTSKRLDAYYRQKLNVGQPRWSQDQDHYRFSYQAYAGYVLAKTKRARLSFLRDLAKDKHYAKSPLPLVHLAAALHLMGDKPAAEELLKLAFKTERAEGYLGEYGSNIRDKALLVHVLLTHHLDTEQAQKYSFELANALKNKQYLSTQERNSLFMAAKSLAEQGAGTMAFEVLRDEIREHVTSAKEYNRVFTGNDIQAPISITNTAEGILNTSIYMNGYSELPPEPASNGIQVSKAFYTLEGEKTAIERLASGDMVLVAITAQSDQRRMPDALIVDLLPAGLELENQNLEHSAKLGGVEIDGTPLADMMGNDLVHVEYRDDRFVAAVSLQRHRATTVYYLARAVTPGQYTIPPVFVEDMYQPELHAIGRAHGEVTISNGATTVQE